MLPPCPLPSVLSPPFLPVPSLPPCPLFSSLSPLFLPVPSLLPCTLPPCHLPSSLSPPFFPVPSLPSCPLSSSLSPPFLPVPSIPLYPLPTPKKKRRARNLHSMPLWWWAWATLRLRQANASPTWEGWDMPWGSQTYCPQPTWTGKRQEMIKERNQHAHTSDVCMVCKRGHWRVLEITIWNQKFLFLLLSASHLYIWNGFRLSNECQNRISGPIWLPDCMVQQYQLTQGKWRKYVQ